MKQYRIRVFAVIVALGLPLAGLAEQVGALYQAVVAVRDQSEQSANLRAALAQVSVKVTGRRAVQNELAESIAALDDNGLMALVQGLAYRNQPAWPGNPLAQSLAVDFIPAAIDRLLSARHIGKWSGNRPLVLVWLLLQEDGQGQWVNPETFPDTHALVQAAAGQRGLPVLFPLLDIDDLQGLPAQSLATADEDAVRKASARYNPDVILTVSARRAAQGWQSDWHAYNTDRPLRWAQTGMDLPQLLQDGIDSLTDTLAQQYAGNFNAPPATFDLLVEGVSRVGDYAQVQSYLAGLDIVDDAQLLEADGQRLHFRIDARGGAKGFAQAAKLGGLLEAVEAPDTNVLVYRLRGF